MKNLFVLCLVVCMCCGVAAGQGNAGYTTKELIYGRKDGMALTMIVLSPKSNSNSKAIINVVLGNYVSTYNWVAYYQDNSKPFIDRGYTVFLVLLGSQPRYTIPDQVQDMERAIRYVRYHSKENNIDPDHIGITGASAGGHLSLLAGTLDNTADPSAKDPVDQVSSRVQAVACFYPPTDFLNFGIPNANQPPPTQLLVLARVAAAFDFRRWNDTLQAYVPVTNATEKTAIVKQISPVYTVTPDDPPVMIIHGDADRVVPLQQSEEMIKKLKEVNIPCTLVVKKGGGHGWSNQTVDEKGFVDWFDKYLK